MIKLIIRLIPVFSLLLLMIPAYGGGIPAAISYQGKLINETGKPVEDGTYSVGFNIYKYEDDEKPMWQSKPMMVNTVGGLFITLISGIPADLFDSDSTYLETVINERPLGPRQKIVSVGYAFRAGKADSVAIGAITNSQVSASAGISPSKIAGTAWTGQNDGAGSGLDADRLDGLDSTAFVKPGDASSVTGQMIQDGTVSASDISLPTSLSVSSSGGSVLKGLNTHTLSGWGLWGSTAADGSSGFAAGVVGNHGSSLRNPQEWNSNYKRIGVYGYSAYSSGTATSSGHGVVGWSEQGYGGLFHSTGSYALVTDGPSQFSGNVNVIGGITLSGNQSVSASGGVTIDGPGSMDVVVTSSDITIKGDSNSTFVKILANGNIEIKSAMNINLTAGNTLNLSGTMVNINSGATTQINAGSVVDVNGAMITLN